MWFMGSEVSVHGKLILLFLGSGGAEHRGSRSVEQSCSLHGGQKAAKRQTMGTREKMDSLTMHLHPL